MQQRWTRWLLAVYLLALAVVTLIPVVGPATTGGLVHLAEALGAGHSPHTVQIVDGVTNTALFVPAGLLLGAVVPRMPLAGVWLICLTASVAVEVAQAVAVPGREASLVDVATNALGAGMGVLLCAALRPRSPVG